MLCSIVIQLAAESLDWSRNLMAAKYRVTVNLEEPEYRVLSALSGKHRVSLAWLGRQAIIEFLERHEEDALQLPLILSSERRSDQI